MSEIINTCGGETCKKNSKEVNRYPTLYEKSHKNYVGKNANCKMYKGVSPKIYHESNMVFSFYFILFQFFVFVFFEKKRYFI